MDDVTPRAAWLPADFQHPTRVSVSTGHHLRPIRSEDVDLDHRAVMGSRERLWSVYGVPWGWPPESLTVEQDRQDLARHEAETAAHESFCYALFDEAETALLGCVYIAPSDVTGPGADVSWWVVDELVGTEVERALDALVPSWLAREWPLRAVLVGREMSWAEWLARAGRGDSG